MKNISCSPLMYKGEQQNFKGLKEWQQEQANVCCSVQQTAQERQSRKDIILVDKVPHNFECHSTDRLEYSLPLPAQGLKGSNIK